MWRSSLPKQKKTDYFVSRFKDLASRHATLLVCCFAFYTPLKTAKNLKKEKTMVHKADNKKEVGADVKFERIRRITGYLVGTTDRFNDAKRAEVRDRVKHGVGTQN